MRVLFIGESEHTAIRRKAAHESDIVGEVVSESAPTAPVESGTVCFVSLPLDQAVAEAQRQIRLGAHVFLDIPQILSVRDIGLLSRMADEAGAFTGVSRPLRYSPGVADVAGRGTIVAMESHFGSEPEAWTRSLVNTLDLCMYLCGTGGTRRVEAAVDRSDRVWPRFGAVSIRFDNGSLALVSLRRSGPSSSRTTCVVSHDAGLVELEAKTSPIVLEAETKSFIAHVAGRSQPIASAADGLAGTRLLDQVMALLR